MTAAVFDCMVFLQAATNDRGPAFACLELVEVNDLMKDAAFTGKFPQLRVVDPATFLIAARQAKSP